MVIKVNRGELFEKWLEWLNPLIPLKELDRKVLGAYITLHYLHKDRYTEEALNDLLFTDDTVEIVAKRLNITVPAVHKCLKNLNKLKIINDKKLHPSLTKYPVNNKFSLKVDFEIIDE